MKKSIYIEGIGQIDAKGNELLGKYEFICENNKFNKISKTRYSLQNGEEEITLTVCGNIFTGKKIEIRNRYYILTNPIAWYCYIFMFLPIILGLTLGNIDALVDHGIYFVGGAIGGAIGGLMTGFAITVSTLELKWYIKLPVLILLSIATFFILLGLGTAIVAALKSINIMV